MCGYNLIKIQSSTENYPGLYFFLDIERSQDKCKKQSLKNGQVQGMGDLKVVRYKGWIFQMFEIVGRQPQVVGHSQNI